MVNANLVKELREKTGAGMLDCKKALTASDGDLDKAVDWLREKGISKAASKSDRIAAEGLADIMVLDNQAAILEMNCETDFVAKNPEFQELVKQILKVILENNVKTVDAVLKLSVENQKVEDLIVAKTAKIGEKISLRRFTMITKQNNEIFGSYIHLGGKIAVLNVLKGDNEEVARDVAMHIAAMNPSYINSQQVPQSEIEKEKAILKEQAISEGKSAEIAEKMVNGRIAKYFKEICLIEQSFVKDQDLSVATYLENNNTEVLDFIRYEVGEGMEKRTDNFVDEVKNQLKS